MTEAPHVVVLGADGFVGSAVTRRGVAAGLRITPLCAGSPWRLEDIAGDPILVGNAWADARFEERLTAALRGAVALVMLAYRPPQTDDDEGRREHEAGVNTAGAVIAARSAAAAGARLVFASTADVYGPWHPRPVAETAEPRPVTAYAEAKLEAERTIRSLELEATALRLATVYGPGETGHRAIPRFVEALLEGAPITIHGDGSDVRDYVHVDDVAAALIRAATTPTPPPPVVNIGSGVGRRTLEIAEAVASAVGGDASITFTAHPRAPSKLVLDVALARSVLDLDPRLDLTTALRTEVDWIRARAAARRPTGPAARPPRR